MYSNDSGWKVFKDAGIDPLKYQLVLAFGSSTIVQNPAFYESLRVDYPQADILINSTAGEIADTSVSDDSASIVGIHLEKSTVRSSFVQLGEVGNNSFRAGELLAKRLPFDGLVNVFVISDGSSVNGSDLVRGLEEHLPRQTIITGGLAGNGATFRKTLVGLNNVPSEGSVVAIGFYGNHLSVGFGSMGGWDPFGPERLITKAKANILYKIDDQPVLGIYKKYLGEYAQDLPGSALLFPLNIRDNKSKYSVVRTILSVDDEGESLQFAGDVPEGSYGRFMKANPDRLIEGAGKAAAIAMSPPDKRSHTGEKSPDLAIVVSCVGRKLVLDQRVDEEIECVREQLGGETTLSGFYSYGEICPTIGFEGCQLHNQTMTITTFTEHP